MFLRVRDRLINLAAVASAEIGPPSTRGATPLRLRAGNGAELDVVPAGTDLERLTAPVVAGAGEAVFIDAAGTARWAPIVAWRVLRDGAEPIFLGEPKPGAMFLRTPDGALVGTGEFPDRYDSLAAATAAVTNKENDQ